MYGSDLLNFLPFLTCIIVGISYIFIGKNFFHKLMKEKDGKFSIIRSFLVGSIYIFFFALLANFVLVHNVIVDEQGGFAFLLSVVTLFFLLIAGNVIFWIFVSLN